MRTQSWQLKVAVGIRDRGSSDHADPPVNHRGCIWLEDADHRQLLFSIEPDVRVPCHTDQATCKHNSNKDSGFICGAHTSI